MAAGGTCSSYLVTREVPTEFRSFLLRHADLLGSVHDWTIRLLVPRRLRKAAAVYRYAVRDAFTAPLTPAQVNELDWFFRARQGRATEPAPDADLEGEESLTASSEARNYEDRFRSFVF